MRVRVCVCVLMCVCVCVCVSLCAGGGAARQHFRLPGVREQQPPAPVCCSQAAHASIHLHGTHPGWAHGCMGEWAHGCVGPTLDGGNGGVQPTLQQPTCKDAALPAASAR